MDIYTLNVEEKITKARVVITDIENTLVKGTIVVLATEYKRNPARENELHEKRTKVVSALIACSSCKVTKTNADVSETKMSGFVTIEFEMRFKVRVVNAVEAANTIRKIAQLDSL